MGFPDAHSLIRESDQLPLSGIVAHSIIKSAYCDNVFTEPVGVCHAVLAAFIDKPELFRFLDFASIGHSLSSIIVVK